MALQALSLVEKAEPALGRFTLRLRDQRSKGRVTPWTMNPDHGRWPFSMVGLHGSTCMVQLKIKINYKVFGPINVDQEQ